MLEKIKTELAKITSLQSKIGLFFSAFDVQGQLVLSNGVIKTDRTLEQLLTSFYQGLLQKNENRIKKLIFELVEEIKLQNDPNVLVKLSMKERGLFLVQGEGQNSGVILPNTKWIDTIQQALAAIKQKYQLTSQVSIFVFRTRKIELCL